MPTSLEPTIDVAELKLLRSLAMAFIVGIRRVPVDGTRAFDSIEEILKEWYDEFGQHDPYVAAEMHEPLAEIPVPLNRQQRRRQRCG